MRQGLAPVALVALALAACTAPTRPGGYYEDDGPLDTPFDPATVMDAKPVETPPSRGGNPRSYEVFGKTYYVLQTAEGYKERGHASWYGRKFHGRKTSNGERYDMFTMTAAHKTLPLPTFVRVTHLGNGRSVIVKVNDRGPFREGRIIDLSYAAAAKLDLLRAGSALVEVEAVNPGAPPPELLTAYLEAGAFDDAIDAVALRAELQDAGLMRVEVRTGLSDGAERHRVLVGPFPDAAALAEAQRRLEERRLPARPVPD